MVAWLRRVIMEYLRETDAKLRHCRQSSQHALRRASRKLRCPENLVGGESLRRPGAFRGESAKGFASPTRWRFVQRLTDHGSWPEAPAEAEGDVHPGKPPGDADVAAHLPAELGRREPHFPAKERAEAPQRREAD